jgi:hypothetical protein
MPIFKLVPIFLLLISCAKDYKCIKYVPKMERRLVYEFNYEGRLERFVTDENGVDEKGVFDTVYEIYGIHGCCKVVARFPKNKTFYKIVNDTLIQNGTNCVEWRTRGKG